MLRDIEEPTARPATDDAIPVRIVRIDIPFEDVLALVFKVLFANLLIAGMIGLIAGALWLFSGGF